MNLKRDHQDLRRWFTFKKCYFHSLLSLIVANALWTWTVPIMVSHESTRTRIGHQLTWPSVMCLTLIFKNRSKGRTCLGCVMVWVGEWTLSGWPGFRNAWWTPATWAEHSFNRKLQVSLFWERTHASIMRVSSGTRQNTLGNLRVKKFS